jgi:hypothetical protein
MKKLLTAGIVLLLGLVLFGSARAQTTGGGIAREDVSGVYDVVFTSDQGQQQAAKITIEDRHNGKVDVSGTYKGYPVSITGDLSGDPAKEGAVCSFNIDQPGIITGKAEFTIRLVSNQYELQGQGSGAYSYLGSSGGFSGQVQGKRAEPVTQSSESSLRKAAIGTGLALGFVILLYVVWRRRAKRTT